MSLPEFGSARVPGGMNLNGWSMSANAFHEKAGRCQVGSVWFLLVICFSPAELPLSPPFHPHSSMSDFVSLGASWVFLVSVGAAT
jgi:hypothetical protein